MTDSQQDILSQTLLRLENALTSFGTIQNSFKEAREELIHAEKEWGRLTKEQQQSVLELVSATKSAINNTNVITSQTKEITETLITLAKAIETVNFPLRLDKIDIGVSTQASAIVSIQGVTERGFRDINGKIEMSEKRLSEGVNTVINEIGTAKKQNVVLISFLVLNTLVLIGFAVWYFMHGNNLHVL